MLKTFKRGVHPPESKYTASDPLSEFETPDRVFISLAQSVGAPCEAVVKEGDKVYKETKNCALGNAVSVEVGDSINYGTDSSGNFVKSSKDGYKSIRITTEVDGEIGENGVTVGVTRYGVGHTFTFYAGNAKLYGKVSAINPIGG